MSSWSIGCCDAGYPTSPKPATPCDRAHCRTSRGARHVTTTEAPSCAPNLGQVIIKVAHVFKQFTRPDGQPLPVLDDIDFELREGEIVALLGKSGSGKSTLLRCIAGLIAPTSGMVEDRGQPLNGANPGVSMVFQSFALLPWLTVQANVEMGLEALGVPP